MSSLFHPEVVIVHHLLSWTADAWLDHKVALGFLFSSSRATVSEDALLGGTLF